MGTTADKLNKLKATKEAIRTAINNKGGTLTTSDKFSDYATAIDNIQSGGGGSLKTLLDATKSCSSLFSGYDGTSVDDLISYNDTSSVTNMSYMFDYCSNLTTIPQLDTSSCTNMSYMFYNCTNLTSIPLIDTSSCTSMNYMFYKCTNLTSIPLIDTSSCTSMNYMFYNCTNLTSIPLIDTSSCTSMVSMLEECYKLMSIKFLKSNKVSSMERMFNYCTRLQNVQLDTSSCTNMAIMFQNCYVLNTIDITHMKINSTSNSRDFAYYCNSLTKLIIRNMDTIPTLNSGAFYRCYHFYGTQNNTYNPDGLKDGRIYVPDDKVEELKTATNWSVFADIIVPLSTLVEE